MQKILYIFMMITLLSSCGFTYKEASQEKTSSLSQGVSEVGVSSWTEENTKIQVLDSDEIPTEESIVSDLDSGLDSKSPVLPVASDDMDSPGVTMGD